MRNRFGYAFLLFQISDVNTRCGIGIICERIKQRFLSCAFSVNGNDISGKQIFGLILYAITNQNGKISVIGAFSEIINGVITSVIFSVHSFLCYNECHGDKFFVILVYRAIIVLRIHAFARGDVFFSCK